MHSLTKYLSSRQDCRLNSRLNSRLGIFVLLLLLLASCARNLSESNWPSDLPAREIFVQAHQRQVANGTNQLTLKKHLTWIKRFYKGSVIYPIGWNQMTNSLVKTIASTEEKNSIVPRMAQLGEKISIEWVQTHNKRKINSIAIAVWGNALRTASKQNQQSEFVGKVERDVEALLAGSLHVSAITRERYYPPEDFDNF